MQGWRGGPGRAAPARHPPLPRTVLRKEGSDIGGGCGEQDGRSRHSGGAPQEVDGGESAGEEREARGRDELRAARELTGATAGWPERGSERADDRDAAWLTAAYWTHTHVPARHSIPRARFGIGPQADIILDNHFPDSVLKTFRALKYCFGAIWQWDGLQQQWSSMSRYFGEGGSNSFPTMYFGNLYFNFLHII